MPPQGIYTVDYTIGDKTLTFRRPAANRPISAQDIPFNTVLESIDIDNIIKIVSGTSMTGITCMLSSIAYIIYISFLAILCERQIILHSSSLSLLTDASEVLRALIYPFSWDIIYIPVLPETLLTGKNLQ